MKLVSASSEPLKREPYISQQHCLPGPRRCQNARQRGQEAVMQGFEGSAAFLALKTGYLDLIAWFTACFRQSSDIQI